MKKIKVILVDDHAVVRAGYKMLLKNIDAIEVVAEAVNGEDAVQVTKDYNPDVIVMDISLPGMGGIEAIRQIILLDGNAKILVFSMHEELIFVEQALQAGAYGYMTKSANPELLSKAIKQIYNGKKYIDDELQKRMLYKKSTKDDSQLSDLSTREFQIFCLLAEGLTAAEISKQLSISYKTAANYGTQIKNKLNVATVADIARLAIRNNIIKA